MAFYDRVRVVTATTGTGTITLGSAIAGYQTPASAAVPTGAAVSYLIEDGAAWETGRGTYTSAGTTLSRTLVQSSTGSLLSLSGSAKVALTLLGSDLAAIAARVFNSASISIANSTATALTFDSERRDDGAIHDTGTNTDRLTAPSTGWYYIWGNVEYAANATGFRTTSIRLNVGATIIAATQAAAVSGVDATIMAVNCLYYLTAGDYVKLFVYQNSGGALNITGPSAGFTYSPEFGMCKISY